MQKEIEEEISKLGIMANEKEMAAVTATTAKVNDASKLVCQICKRSDTDEYNYGPWKTSDGYTVHYFCAVSI